jgi:ribosomal protein L30E
MFRLKRTTLREELETEADLGYIPVGTFQISNIERENVFLKIFILSNSCFYVSLNNLRSVPF